jgi:hypothetical protein
VNRRTPLRCTVWFGALGSFDGHALGNPTLLQLNSPILPNVNLQDISLRSRFTALPRTGTPVNHPVASQTFVLLPGTLCAPKSAMDHNLVAHHAINLGIISEKLVEALLVASEEEDIVSVHEIAVDSFRWIHEV